MGTFCAIAKTTDKDLSESNMAFTLQVSWLKRYCICSLKEVTVVLAEGICSILIFSVLRTLKI
jgi:hypothetical protein